LLQAVNHRANREIVSLPRRAIFAFGTFAQKMPRPWDSMAAMNLRIGPMHRMRGLQLCALSLALTLLPGAARAQTAEPSSDAAPAELSPDAPLDPSMPELDLSTPEPDPGKLGPIHPSTGKASAADWSGRSAGTRRPSRRESIRRRSEASSARR
jgi:hypothetical protein